MNIGILTIGDELTSGRIRDLNSPLIIREAARMGWVVSSILSVGDEISAIQRAINYFPDHCRATIVTGGLGATSDDMTTEAMARTWGRQLIRNEQVLSVLRDHVSARGFRWTEKHARQAQFPEGAEPIPNPVGSAWGFSLTHRDCLFIVLPGVPEEAAVMITDQVLPRLHRIDPSPNNVILSRTFKCFGISENEIEEKIRALIPHDEMTRIGFYPLFPEVHLVLTIRNANQKQAKENLRNFETAITDVLQPHLFGRDHETLEGVVGNMLRQKRLGLAVAESCTGGLITDRLTDVAGSSEYLERGVVSYSNASKISLLKVPRHILVDHGAVSESTARYMAEGIRTASGVQLGLSTTGIAGPAGAVPGKPVGTVYIALAHPGGTVCRHCVFPRDRRRVKVAATHTALMMLREYLNTSPPGIGNP
ncbi:MAG: CinA family nicotinamide mononucleotide deamidase-related protein [Deltaproteobacteria bacterium]|nr:CinA family nicotinamide mononucleotide deamidase-related protein [Deltaproteobacteria bacterium]